MEKQRAVNTVTANDEYSQNLMKMYENWMDGDTFQGSYKGETVKEEEIPTGQKQGGGTGAAFKTAIGELPAIEFDKSAAVPTIPELGVTDNTEKNTKTHDSANDGGPAVALKGSMTIGQGDLSSGDKQTHGAAIRNTTLVAKEEKESIEEKKAKKDYDGDGKVESGKAEYFGSKDKAIKKAMKKEDATYGYDKKGNSLNPKDKKKAMKKEEVECCKKCGSKDHTTKECKATKEEVEIYQEEVKMEEWKVKAKKKSKKIMSYYGKK